MVKATKLGFRYASGWIFKNLDFTHKAGERVVITGPNGSGKTTLLRLMGKFLSPTAGSVSIELQTGATHHNRFEWLGFASPSFSLYPDFTPAEHIHLQLANHPALKVKSLEDWLKTDWIAACGLPRSAWQKPGKSLSTGMQQRVKLILSLIHQPPLVLWDEPYSNLDESGRQWVEGLVGSMSPDQLLMIASNQPEEVVKFASRIDLAATAL